MKKKKKKTAVNYKGIRYRAAPACHIDVRHR